VQVCYRSRSLGLQRSAPGWSRCGCRAFCCFLWAVQARRELVWRAAGVAQAGKVSAGKKPARQN